MSPIQPQGRKHILRKIDPEGIDQRALIDLIDFTDLDVLEVGCGDGRMTWGFANISRSVLALDPDDSAIAAARAQTPEALMGKLTFQVADITKYELPRDTFHVAVFSWSM